MQRLLAEALLTTHFTDEFFSKSSLMDLRQMGRLALTSSCSLKLLLGIRKRYTTTFGDKIEYVAELGLNKKIFSNFWSLPLFMIYDMMIGNSTFPRMRWEVLGRESALNACCTLVERLKSSVEEKDTMERLCKLLARKSRKPDVVRSGVHVGFVCPADNKEVLLGPLSISHSPSATRAMIEEMFWPRVRASYLDALYCYLFVRMLEGLRILGLQMLDFCKHWADILHPMLSECSCREAACLGFFTGEMMSHIKHLATDQEAFREFTNDNPCWHRNYYSYDNRHAQSVVQNDLTKFLTKMEGKLTLAVKHALESDKQNMRRVSLVFLDQCSIGFPRENKYARMIQKIISGIRDVELMVLANAVNAKIACARLIKDA